ncbi:MAG: GDSL family lipase [Burkholderiaceae bacterium]|nr:SGNH/GDSL hydrolase family protein [Pseudomonadota bacterium]MBS0598657.1 SGNH/GDSL hydrolase family protein [Pseudomonadota bacterium]MCO5115379.1 SGNH/GDSL hydrolase family protein [Burkholderiaceae bacterium]MCP5217241.1 GDSL family lipase [Burkholderiaceae bacterium]
MPSLWIRRAAGGLLVAATALLASCGSGSVVSDLKPERFISVGDGFADVGQNGHRYTVNDGTYNWLQQLASYYNLTVAPASAGGFGYAQGNARVALADTTSGTNAPSVTAQIDTLLARTALGPNDVVFVNGGMSDIVDAVAATGISAATDTAIDTAARALADQVRRVVAAGATHVVVSGVYNLGITPWARNRNIANDATRMSVAFNDRLLTQIVDMGATVLYFDPALFFNLIYNKPESYPVDNNSDPVCTTPDASTCTPATLVAGADYTRWLFADGLYFTPAMLRLFTNEGYLENAYTRFKNRW